ncbi:MAG: hypothetical protein MPJ78_10405 [Hyphomicrobiaceae bacterium]|nr:hypothetical protein [Hyphomicrobiaceae bacterium]
MAARCAAAIAFLIVSVAQASAAPIGANDIARYLAGLAPSPESPLAPLTRERNWQFHAATLNKAWSRIEKNQLRPIRAWAKTHIPVNRKQMLYMFSGPDFLYADAFYPNAETYVLSALEPIGPIPKIWRLPPGARAGALQELRASMQTVLSYSFFITKQMKTDLRSGNMRGTLPVLFVFLARSGNTITEVEYVHLNPDGLAVPANAKLKGSSPGVRIAFKDEAGKSRTLYYFQTDLSNGGLRRSGFLAFSQSLGRADSLVKSASYLLHSGNFSIARKFLLKQSDVIVQDDSGIPLRFFNRKTWALHPFGRYVGPISIFPNNYQRDMASLFARSRNRKMTFGIGYRWRRHETHVLLAIRKNP